MNIGGKFSAKNPPLPLQKRLRKMCPIFKTDAAYVYIKITIMYIPFSTELINNGAEQKMP